MVDYLGLLHARGAGRYEQITAVSLALHELAQRTGVLVVALSQLSRAGAGMVPRLEDLRESGQIEQDADAVLLLHPNRDDGVHDLLVAKNKEGRTGAVAMHFDGETQRFTEVAHA